VVELIEFSLHFISKNEAISIYFCRNIYDFVTTSTKCMQIRLRRCGFSAFFGINLACRQRKSTTSSYSF